MRIRCNDARHIRSLSPARTPRNKDGPGQRLKRRVLLTDNRYFFTDTLQPLCDYRLAGGKGISRQVSVDLINKINTAPSGRICSPMLPQKGAVTRNRQIEHAGRRTQLVWLHSIGGLRIRAGIGLYQAVPVVPVFIGMQHRSPPSTLAVGREQTSPCHQAPGRRATRPCSSR